MVHELYLNKPVILKNNNKQGDQGGVMICAGHVIWPL